MGTATGLSKQEYAARFDGCAAELYRFALCVTGDKKEAEAAMAKLFCEGYADAKNENFFMHMLKILRQILESCTSDSCSYRERIKSVFPHRNHDKLTDLLSGLSVKQRAALLQKLMFEGAQTRTV